MSKSEDFEKQIARIYELLVQNHADVKWNDKIPDPDNPKQLRQIDITIKDRVSITHIECRSHKKRQNAKWIEELYGRKIGLNVDTYIAVSDSGFTEGAIKKAERFGIFLRNLEQLSDDEIGSWGKKSKIFLSYYQLDDISFCFVFDSIKKLNLKKVASELQNRPEYVDALFNIIKYRLNSQRHFNYPYCFRFESHANNMKLCGRNVKGAKIQGAVSEVFLEFECPYIAEYVNPHVESNIQIGVVEKADTLNVEIIKSNKLVSVYFDISKAPQAPINAILSGVVKFDFGQPTGVPKFSISGMPEQRVNLNNAEFSIIKG